MNLYTDYKTNYQILNEALRASHSFDLVCRQITIQKRKSCLYFIDGLVKDEIMEKIMEFFFSVDDESFMESPYVFTENCVPYVEVDVVNNVDKIVTGVLSGMCALIVDGFSAAILIDSRTYP